MSLFCIVIMKFYKAIILNFAKNLSIIFLVSFCNKFQKWANKDLSILSMTTSPSPPLPLSLIFFAISIRQGLIFNTEDFILPPHSYLIHIDLSFIWEKFFRARITFEWKLTKKLTFHSPLTPKIPFHEIINLFV